MKPPFLGLAGTGGVVKPPFLGLAGTDGVMNPPFRGLGGIESGPWRGLGGIEVEKPALLWRDFSACISVYVLVRFTFLPTPLPTWSSSESKIFIRRGSEV